LASFAALRHRTFNQEVSRQLCGAEGRRDEGEATMKETELQRLERAERDWPVNPLKYGKEDLKRWEGAAPRYSGKHFKPFDYLSS
jgi:hypothetical protein